MDWRQEITDLIQRSELLRDRKTALQEKLIDAPDDVVRDQAELKTQLRLTTQKVVTLKGIRDKLAERAEVLMQARGTGSFKYDAKIREEQRKMEFLQVEYERLQELLSNFDKYLTEEYQKFTNLDHEPLAGQKVVDFGKKQSLID